MSEFLYPDGDERSARLVEIDSALSKLLEDNAVLQRSIDELYLERDIILRLDILEKYLNKEINVDLKIDKNG